MSGGLAAATAGLALCALAGYLLGSVSGSLLLGRARRIDIRTLGSGNAGGTNAFRTQGMRFAIGVVLIDVGKAALATALARHFAPVFGGDPTHAGIAAALAAMTGHVWPLWHGFRGGKGAAAFVGALLVLWPLGALIGAIAWASMLIATGWVGLATMFAGVSVFIGSFAAPETVRPAFLLWTGTVVLLLTWTHRDNIARLRAGTEHRFERARVWRRRPQS